MQDRDWRSRHPAAEVVESLASRIDEVRRLVDSELYREARMELHRRAWTSGPGAEGVPPPVLEEAEEWLDIAHDALRQMPVEADGARRALIKARRAITG